MSDFSHPQGSETIRQPHPAYMTPATFGGGLTRLSNDGETIYSPSIPETMRYALASVQQNAGSSSAAARTQGEDLHDDGSTRYCPTCLTEAWQGAQTAAKDCGRYVKGCCSCLVTTREGCCCLMTGLVITGVVPWYCVKHYRDGCDYEKKKLVCPDLSKSVASQVVTEQPGKEMMTSIDVGSHLLNTKHVTGLSSSTGNDYKDITVRQPSLESRQSKEPVRWHG